MKVHLFGAVSSPSCSNYALRKAADDSETLLVLRPQMFRETFLR